MSSGSEEVQREIEMRDFGPNQPERMATIIEPEFDHEGGFDPEGRNKEKDEEIIVASEYRINDSGEMEEELGRCGKILRCIDDPFSTVSDKTIQRTGDIYLPIPGAASSLGASFALAAHAPTPISGALTLFGATTSMAGKVVSAISDRRMLKQPIKVAREAGADEEELSPQGVAESLAYYANRINLVTTMLSGAGIILGGLFLFGVISNNDNNGTHSSSNDSGTFGNSEMLGILLNGVAFIDNCLKILKGCEIEYRDRLTQLSKDHLIQREEIQKLLPDMFQSYYEIIGELIEAIDRSDQVSVTINEEEIDLQMLRRNCAESLNRLDHARNSAQFHQKIYSRMGKELKLPPNEEEELKSIEKKLEGMQKELCNILLEKDLDQQHQQAIILWEKITSSILPLCKIKAMREYYNFLKNLWNGGILSEEFLEPIKDIEDRASAVSEILIRQVDIMNILQDMQISTIKYNREDLDSIMNVLNNIDLLREQPTAALHQIKNM